MEAAPSLESFLGRLKMSLVLGTLLAKKLIFPGGTSPAPSGTLVRPSSAGGRVSWWWLRLGEAGASRRKTEGWVQLLSLWREEPGVQKKVGPPCYLLQGCQVVAPIPPVIC